MKKSILMFLAALLACVPLGAGVAEAAVAGSRHDMTIAGFIGTWGGQGVCSYCHVPHAAKGARLWAAPTGSSTAAYGTAVVQLLCFSCHDGTASTLANHTLSVYNAAKVNHVMLDTNTIPETTQSGTNWPYTTALGSMECSSCHNPHDGTFNQFLRDQPYAATATAITLANDPTANSSQFCNVCHQGRTLVASRNGTAGSLTGTHPVGAAVIAGRKYGVLNTVTVNPTAVAPNRILNEVIDNTVTGPGVLGGHLSGYTTGGVICNTCHMPHGATGNRVLAWNNTVGVGFNGLCEGCHSVQPSLRFNVDRSAHPVNAGTGDGVTASGTISIVDWNFATNLVGAAQGTGGEVVCLSCHDVHQANGATAILRQELRTVDGSICNDCHGTAPIPGANHPATAIAGAGSSIVNEDGGTWPNNDGLPLFATGGAPNGTMVTCDTCHAAHDGQTGATHLLRITNANSAICNGCHTQLDNTATTWTGTVAPPALGAAVTGDSANPSQWIMNQGYAGNFGTLGLITQRGTHASNRIVDPAAPKQLYKRVLTATSGRSNRYGTTGNTMICNSCHLVHGADINGGWHGTAGSKDLLFKNNGVGGGRSGLDGGTAAYDPAIDSYCSACHMVAPNPVAPTGTHPVQSWTVTRTNAAVNTTNTSLYANVSPPAANADYFGGAGGVMTCESCHAPHAAVTNFGTYILEAGTNGGSGTGGSRPVAARNRDPLCAKCHTY